MNCASVTIGSGGRKKKRNGPVGVMEELKGVSPPLEEKERGAKINATVIAEGELRKRAFSGEAPLFIANIGNGCTTVEGTDVVFPSPGKDVEYSGIASKQGSPRGTCNGKTYTGGGATGGTAGSASSSSSSSGQYSGGGSSGLTYDDGMYRGEGSSYSSSGATGSGTATGQDAIAGTVGWNSGQGRGEAPGCEYWRSVGYLCAAGNGLKVERWVVGLATVVGVLGVWLVV